MKKYAYYLLLIFVISCSKEGSRTVIKGKLIDADGKYLYFKEITVKNDGEVDSLKLSNSGSFKFVRRIKYPTFFSVWVGKQKGITLALLPGEKVIISGNAGNLNQTYNVEGSKESERIESFSRVQNLTIQKIDSLYKVLDQFKNNPNIAQIQQTLSYNYQHVIDQQRELTIMLLNQDPASIANIYLLYQKSDPSTENYILYKDEDFKYFDRTDSILYFKYPKAPHIINFHARVNDFRIMRQQIKAQRIIANMGAQAPEIALPSPNGDTIRLSSFRGKYVLVNFWSSSNLDCKENNMDLVELYKIYHPKGFEILQVSLDDSKQGWLDAIQKEQLSWNHVCDFKKWDSKPVKAYNVESLPKNFFIDKDGTLTGYDLRGAKLEAHLKLIFGTK